MSAKVVRYNIINDYTDKTASDVRTANPGLFATDADVPEYLYKSLKTLWLGSSAASSEFAARVSPYLGGGDSDSRGSITVVQISTIESSQSQESIMQDDQIGAENAEILITMRIPRVAQTTDLLDNVCQRLKYILDMNYRYVRGLPSDLSIGGDNTIADQYYKCLFYDYGQEQRTGECTILFKVAYVRKFGR